GEFLEALHAVQEEVGFPAGTATTTSAPRTNLRMTAIPTSNWTAPLGDSLRMTAMQRAAAPVPAQHQDVQAAPQESTSGSKRMIWIGAGSLVAVAAIVGFIQFGSKGKNDAKPDSPFTVTEPSAKPASSSAAPKKGAAQSAAPTGESGKQPGTP